MEKSSHVARSLATVEDGGASTACRTPRRGVADIGPSSVVIDGIRLPAAADDEAAARVHQIRLELAFHNKQHHQLTRELAKLLAEASVDDTPALHVVEHPVTNEPDGLLTAAQAAEYVGCHVNTVYAAVKAGKLRARGFGRMLRFTRADLRAWTETRS